MMGSIEQRNTNNNKVGAPRWVRDAVVGLADNTWKTPLWWATSVDDNDDIMGQSLLPLLATNTSVKTVIFQSATLSSRTRQAFATAMGQNCAIRSLTLRNLKSLARIDGDGDNNSDFPQEQQQHQPLIQEEEPLSIPSTVFSNPNLEALHIATATLDASACASLAELLVTSSNLRSLRLEQVRLDKDGFASFLSGLIDAKSLETLRMQQAERWTRTDLERFLQAISYNTSITTLSLEGCELNAVHAPALAKMLQTNKTLTQLSLRRNMLDAAALDELVSQGLFHNATLKSLLLSRNPLGQDSGPHLAKLLLPQKLSSSLSRLEELCLIDTQLSHRACMDITRALQQQSSVSSSNAPTLRTLHMDGNAYNSEAFGKALVEALHYNVHVHHVLDRLPSLLAANPTNETGLWNQVDFYLRCNRAQRQFLRLGGDPTMTSHLPLILAQTPKSPQPQKRHQQQPDVLHYFLTQSLGTHNWLLQQRQQEQR